MAKELAPIPGTDTRTTVAEQLRELIAQVPETSGEDAQYRIVEQILAAKDVSQLDDPWTGSSALGALADQMVTIRSVRRAPSQFEAGTGVFLILECMTAEGEIIIVTTGAVSVVTQILKALQLRPLPFQVVPKVSAKPSAKGYYPQHLEFLTA
jgi:hypothetical protein